MTEQEIFDKILELKKEANNRPSVGCLQRHHDKFDPSCKDCCEQDIMAFLLYKLAQHELSIDELRNTTGCSY